MTVEVRRTTPAYRFGSATHPELSNNIGESKDAEGQIRSGQQGSSAVQTIEKVLKRRSFSQKSRSTHLPSSLGARGMPSCCIMQQLAISRQGMHVSLGKTLLWRESDSFTCLTAYGQHYQAQVPCSIQVLGPTAGCYTRLPSQLVPKLDMMALI